MKFGLFLLCFFSSLASAAPLTDANSKWNINRNRDGSDPSKYYGEWPGHRYFPSPADWRDIGIYQFVTDRFSDGDPTNNEGKYGGYDLYDVTTRHGGDFRGLTAKLDYIKGLGYDAIWVSPVFQNRYNSYHGYGQIDFTLLDERFGTLQEFRELVDEAHKRGMYVIVDIVVNHLENLYYFEGYPKLGDSTPFRFHAGEYRQFPRDPKGPFDGGYEDFKVNNTFDPTGVYPPVYGYDGLLKRDRGTKLSDKETAYGSFWQSDLNHNGDIGDYGDPWHNHLGKIYGSLDDIRTSHPRVQDKIIAMTKALISSVDVDGIRMDTPMQVPLYFFDRWSPAVKAHARSLGKDDFLIYGEFYCPRVRAATMVGRGKTKKVDDNDNLVRDNKGNPIDVFIRNEPRPNQDVIYPFMDGGINYDFYFNFAVPAIKEQERGRLRGAKQHFDYDMQGYDFYNPIRRENRYAMLNFVNNHDQWRMSWSEDGFQKTLLGNAVIAFWPGIPLAYYGDDQGFSTPGGGIGGESREDFMTSKAWFDQRSKSSVNPAIYDNFNMTHPHYRFIQKMMNVRKQYHALRNTDEMYERYAENNANAGMYAFTRVWSGDNKNWVLVAFNTWKFRRETDGPNKLYTGWNEGDEVVNALNPSEGSIKVLKDGELPQISLDGYETKVFVRTNNLQTLFPVVEEISPKHDAALNESGQTNIVLKFSEPMRAQSLKDAIRFNGVAVPMDRVTLEGDKRTIRFSADVADGIHKVSVLPSATAENGKGLMATFSSRFRVGNKENPIIKMQKDALEDAGLVEMGAGQQFSLRHKAAGAVKYRYSLDGKKSWSAWEPYAATTRHTAPGDALDVVVQYWADGSAAYFAHGKGSR